MATTYGEAQRKYYHKNRDTIFRKVKKYKAEYNKGYYEKNKEAIKARKKLRALKKLSNSLYEAVENA